jgi:ATP-binding cassette, subfamily B, bacterial
VTDQARSPDQERALAGPEGAISLLRRGLSVTPELRAGFLYTVGVGIVYAVGQIVTPVLVQQILDRGLMGEAGFRPRFVFFLCAVAGVLVIGTYFAGRTVLFRMAKAAENALRTLRVRTFAHVHRLSLAEQTTKRRGVFVSRVTSDMDTLSRFMEWGLLAWITGSTLILGALMVMFVYSWQLTLVVLLFVGPLVLALRHLQKGLLDAYDLVRTRVGETLSEISESVMGAAVIRAYGIKAPTDEKLKGAVRRQYEAQLRANKYMATIFPVSEFFGAFAIGSVLAAGVLFGPGWGLSPGQLVAFLFLVNLFLQPVGWLAETFDQTQTAIAGWRKVLGVLDLPVDLVEPEPGVALPAGPLSVKAEGVQFAYRDSDELVLRGIDAELPPGVHVAIVGETGCGKTTFAKLLSRLADPTGGRIVIGGVDLRELSPASRRNSIRMVPQDGFLFEASLYENVAYGRHGAGLGEVRAAFSALGLDDWVATLPDGLETHLGQRGENLSVGERQFVALARAQIAQPGLLILDEATSAVDPGTERALAEALERLSRGRTTVTIAHRLSTAEAADEVLVFDAGRIVERGDHGSLVKRGGVYASLYQSWLGNTRMPRREAGDPV